MMLYAQVEVSCNLIGPKGPHHLQVLCSYQDPWCRRRDPLLLKHLYIIFPPPSLHWGRRRCRITDFWNLRNFFPPILFSSPHFCPPCPATKKLIISYVLIPITRRERFFWTWAAIFVIGHTHTYKLGGFRQHFGGKLGLDGKRKSFERQERWAARGNNHWEILLR